MKRIASRGLLVRSVAFGEADLVATFFTQTDGKVSAMVRGARRSSKRFGGALEPIHELFLTLDDRGKDLAVLREARLERVRHGITRKLETMDAAGQALRWVRHLCPPRTPEPATWRSLDALFAALDVLGAGEDDARGGAALLATFGLRLLADVGYALELERCVRCDRPCPDGRPAMLDAAGGGLVCMTCGGARRTIKSELRTLAVQASAGVAVTLSTSQAAELVDIVEEAMSAHADFDPAARGA